MDGIAGRQRDLIALAIDAHARRPGPPRQDIRLLGDGIVGAIHMQADAQGRGIADPRQIVFSRRIPGRIALGIRDHRPIPVDGKAIVIPPIQLIAHILHGRQLHLHEAGIVPIGSMAHHTAGLHMGQLGNISRYLMLNALGICP